MKPVLPTYTSKPKPALKVDVEQKVCSQCWALNPRSAKACFLCSSIRLRWKRKDDSPPSRIFIALGPEPSNGRGTTVEAALQSLWDRWPYRGVSKADGWTIKVWDAPIFSTVSGRGGIKCQPHDKPPLMVREFKLWHDLFVPCDFMTCPPPNLLVRHSPKSLTHAVLMLLWSFRARDRALDASADKFVSAY